MGTRQPDDGPYKCPSCTHHLVSRRALATHFNACHSVTLTGTLTEDGEGIVLVPDTSNNQPKATRGSTTSAGKNRAREHSTEIASASTTSNTRLKPAAAPFRVSLNKIPLASSRLPPPGPLSERESSLSSPNLSVVSGLAFETLRIPTLSDEFTPVAENSLGAVSEGRPNSNEEDEILEYSWSDDCEYVDEDHSAEVSRVLSQLEIDGFTDSRSATPISILGERLNHRPLTPATDISSSLIDTNHHDTVSPVHSVFNSSMVRHSTPPSNSRFLPNVRSEQSYPEITSSNVHVEIPSLRKGSCTFSDVRIIHNLISGRPCDKQGRFLPDNAAPQFGPSNQAITNWGPFGSRLQFEMVDLAFRDLRMPPEAADKLIRLLQAYGPSDPNAQPLFFASYAEMIKKIDSIKVGSLPWSVANFSYTGIAEHAAPWMDKTYKVYFRNVKTLALNMLSELPGYDVAPYQEYDEDSNRVFTNYLSGDRSWIEADKIAKEEKTHGSMIVPIILKHDKFTISVAAGQEEYYALFMSVGNMRFINRRGHWDGFTLLALLPIPKAEERHQSEDFRTFKCQLKHQCLEEVLSVLRPVMMQPEVIKCSDGYYRRAIFSIGAHITDYVGGTEMAGVLNKWCTKCPLNPSAFDDFKCASEVHYRKRELTFQSTVEAGGSLTTHELTGVNNTIVPYTHSFPITDITRILTPSILQEVADEGFHKHLLTWIKAYFIKCFGENTGRKYLNELNRRVSISTVFPGLKRYPQGLTTDENPAGLMKILLPCLIGLVPDQVVLTVRYFLDACYLLHRSVMTDRDISTIKSVFDLYHKHRNIFKLTGVCEDFSLPEQHMLFHYHTLIEQFGSPIWLSSSLTEKTLRQCTDKLESMQQILLMTDRFEKLKALRAQFEKLALILPEAVPAKYPDDSDSCEVEEDNLTAYLLFPSMQDIGTQLASEVQPGYPEKPSLLASHIGVPELLKFIRLFLYKNIFPSDTQLAEQRVPPDFYSTEFLDNYVKIQVFHSARAVYYSSNDLYGVGGMRQEIIIARKNEPRYDCVFVSSSKVLQRDAVEICVARIKLFFSFSLNGVPYSCALAQWFKKPHEKPHKMMDMWEIEADYIAHGRPNYSVISVGSIVRAAHLMPKFGKTFTPGNQNFTESLDRFNAFFINKYIDFHAFDFLSSSY